MAGYGEKDALVDDAPSAGGYGANDRPVDAGIAAPATPGFIPTVKRTGGQMLTTLATSIDDITGPNKVTRSIKDTGQGIIDRNPAGITGIGDIVESPWLTVKEAVGQFVPQIGAAAAGGIAGAAAGKRIGGAPGAAVGGIAGSLAPIFTQEYGGIRQEQQEAGKNDIPRALGAAGVATGLERVGMGKILNGFGGVAAKSIPGEIAKGVLREGGTEALQTSVEQVGAFKDPLTRESLSEAGFSGVMGGIGGGIVGGGQAAVNKALAPKDVAPEVIPEVAPAAVAPVAPVEAVAPVVAPLAGDPIRTAKLPDAGPLSKIVNLGVEQEAAAADAGAPVAAPITGALAGVSADDAPHPDTPTATAEAPKQNGSVDGGEQGPTPSAAQAPAPQTSGIGPTFDPETGEIIQPQRGTFPTRDGVEQYLSQQRLNGGTRMGKAIPVELPDKTFSFVREGEAGFIEAGRANAEALAAEKAKAKGEPVKTEAKPLISLQKRRALAAKEKADAQPVVVPADAGVADAAADGRGDIAGGSKLPVGRASNDAARGDAKSAAAPSPSVGADAPVEPASASAAPVKVSRETTGTLAQRREVAKLRKKWPGLADKSDDVVRASEAWNTATQRLVRESGNHDAGNAIGDKLVEELGQPKIAADQVGYLTELTKRLTDAVDAITKDKSTKGTLANRRQEKQEAKDRETSAAVMQKALGQDIEQNLERVREMRRQGRISAADEVRLLALAESSTDSFDAAMKLEGFVSDKEVPSDTAPVGSKAEAANDAPAKKAAPTIAPVESTVAQNLDSARGSNPEVGGDGQSHPVGSASSAATADAPAPTPAPKSLKERREAAKPEPQSDALKGQMEVERRAAIDAETMETRKGLPEIAQPMPGKNVVVVSRTLNGVKRVRAQIWEAPGYNGPQLAVAEYKSPRAQGYRVYMVKSGALAADNNGVKEMDRNETLKLAINRVQNARDAINARAKAKPAAEAKPESVPATPSEKPAGKASEPATPALAPMPAVAGISREAAYNAHRGTSHVPEDRAVQEQQSFTNTLRNAWDRAAAIAGDDRAAVERITSAFQELADGYRQRYTAKLGARSRVMSTMIAGAGNFPVRRNEKANAVADKRATEAEDFLKKGIARLLKAAKAPIDNSPTSELERVQANLAEREALQVKMKAANVALRKGDDAALSALGFSEAQIADLKKPDFAGRLGFPDYRLTNNNAEIRRLRERLADSTQRVADAEAGPTERTFAGVTIKEDATDDRIRLLFEGKPDEAVRADLKANGFKWSPTNEAWQRRLTDNARRAAESVLTKHYAEAATDTAFSRKQSPEAAAAQRIERTQNLVQSITSKWANSPTVTVLVDMADPRVPESVRNADATQKSQGAEGEPAAFVNGGKVYLVASQLKTDQEAIEALHHEALGHLGLRGVFGTSLDGILDKMARLNASQVKLKAAQYGLNFDDPRQRRMAAEEVLAELAQKSPQVGWVKQAVAAIRSWLRDNVSAFANMKYSDDDIAAKFLAPARDYIVKGQGFADTMPAVRGVDFLRAFHGSPHRFEKFSTESIGTGEGAQAYGYGLYFAGRREVADHYRKTLTVRQFINQMMDSYDEYDSPNEAAQALIDSGDLNPQQTELMKALEADDWLGFDYPHQALTAAMKEGGNFEMSDRTKAALANLGKLYTVEIPDEGHYMLWDKPLSEQPAAVQEALNRAGMYDALSRMEGNVYKNVSTLIAKQNGRVTTNLVKDRKAASDFLNGVGIAGVKYLDGTSRKAGDGHYNYVVFDDSKVQMQDAAFSRRTDPNDPAKDYEKLPAVDRVANQVNRTGQAIKAMTATDLKEHAAKAGNKLADYRGIGLQMLGRRQLVDLYAKDIPAMAHYSELVQQMDADKNETGAEADGLATAWGKLPDERQLAELMHDATLAQIDPSKELVAGDNSLQYRRLNAQYNALSPEAQKMYLKARDMYVAHYQKVQDEIRQRIERAMPVSERRAEMLQRMDAEFFGKTKGVYFPLSRFGDYVVVAKDGDKVVSVARAETLNEANATRKGMLAQFADQPTVKVGKVLKSAEFNSSRDMVSKGFIKELFDTLEGQNVPDDVYDSINQLYLESLPDLSWAKHGIHRKGTPGFSQDARRAFAQHMFHGARYLAKLRYSDQLNDGLDAMQKQVGEKSDDANYDSIRAQQVVDEMVKRHESLMNPKTNALSTALTSLGFVFHLGLSPASAIANLSQTALVAFPIMAAKWGYGRSSAALLKASKQTAANKNDISKVLSGDEKRAYDEAVAAGVIDVTQAHDLAGISQGEDSKVAWKIRPVMRAASFLFHHAEKFNRQVTFIAAYRLARETGVVHALAYEQAIKATYDGHFDYSASNRPRIMQGNAAKVLLLFRQFGQNMVYTLARQSQLSLNGATPEVRAEARKALGGLLVMHAAGAGVLGLPLVTTLLSAASMLGSDDDEPWDAEVALRNMLADTFGQKAAQVMAHGLSHLTPWDLSGRVGLSNLILPDLQEGLQGQRLGEAAAMAALGPVAGIGVSVLKGIQSISEGHMALGIETMLPSALRGPMRAYRYATEGAIDKTGVPIKENVSAASVAGQAFGLSPTEVREAGEARRAIYSADKRLMERRSSLMNQFAQASMVGDREGQAEALKDIAAYNKLHPERGINGQQLGQSVKNRIKRINQSEDGVFLPAKRRNAAEAGRFATTED